MLSKLCRSSSPLHGLKKEIHFSWISLLDRGTTMADAEEEEEVVRVNLVTPDQIFCIF